MRDLGAKYLIEERKVKEEIFLEARKDELFEKLKIIRLELKNLNDFIVLKSKNTKILDNKSILAVGFIQGKLFFIEELDENVIVTAMDKINFHQDTLVKEDLILDIQSLNNFFFKIRKYTLTETTVDTKIYGKEIDLFYTIVETYL